jgi:hypothetical protein
MCCGRDAAIAAHLVLAEDKWRAILHRGAQDGRPRAHARSDALRDARAVGMSSALAGVYEGTLCSVGRGR